MIHTIGIGVPLDVVPNKIMLESELLQTGLFILSLELG